MMVMATTHGILNYQENLSKIKKYGMSSSRELFIMSELLILELLWGVEER